MSKKAIEVLKYIVERSESIVVIAHAAIDMLKTKEYLARNALLFHMVAQPLTAKTTNQSRNLWV